MDERSLQHSDKSILKTIYARHSVRAYAPPQCAWSQPLVRSFHPAGFQYLPRRQYPHHHLRQAVGLIRSCRLLVGGGKPDAGG